MKKLKNILLIFITLAVFISVKANADDLPEEGKAYYGIRIGFNTVNKEVNIDSKKLDIEKWNPFISANIGIKLQKFRFELEFAYRCNFIDYDDGVGAISTMGNFYYNFLDLNLLKFFVNIGVGNTKLFSFSEIDKKENFTWNTGLGVNISLFNVANVDIGYRYIDMGKLKLKNEIDLIKLNQKARDIYAGLRFDF